MSRSTTAASTAGRPRKSPLRLATLGEPSLAPHRTGHLSPPQLRLMMIGEFEQWLRSRTNNEKRPFQEETVLAYAKAARALDAWMTSRNSTGTSPPATRGLLNRFFRDYNAGHTRGGTTTKQRNLRHLFTWLEAGYDHPHPYTDDLNRYAPAAGRPSTPSAHFEEEGQVVPVASATARSIAAYLRIRRYHRLADSPFVWLGCETAGRLTGRACIGCCRGGPSRQATSLRCTPTCSGIPSPATGSLTAAPRAT